MTLFPDLLNLPHQLRLPEVRDLAWVILAPPMLTHTPWPQRHPLAGSDWVQAPEHLERWLRELDRNSQPLQHWLEQATTRRLGRYYERLWQFAVQHAPGVELVAANLPIRLGGHTLGELDLLLRDRDGVHHLELAIKLYLGPQEGDGSDPAQWLGPGSNDRLDRKLKHFSQHQLPMSSRPESREVLASLDVQTFSAHLWLGGYLLYPWPGPTRSTCAGAGCISATGRRLSARAPQGAGNPCPGTPGWLRRAMPRKACGPGSSWVSGWLNCTRRPLRNYWCA